MNSGQFQKGSEVGKAFRFKKGSVPFNKGMKRGKGWAPGRMAEGQFKPGNLSGAALDNYRPVGSTRVSKDGYLEIKINDDLPAHRRWRGVHIVLWEEHLGPLPAGFCICFKNGNKQDIRIDNLKLMSRGERMSLNTFLRYPKEIADLIRLRGAVNRQINKRTRNEKQANRSA